MPAEVPSPVPNERMWIPLFAAWVVSLVATLGSLYFSEVMLLPPCVLCWYQRICMYPIAVILTVGLAGHDRRVPRYVWPLALVGLAIAIYHNLLYYDVILETFAPCGAGVSCTDRQIEWIGFITIPLLSFAGFTLIVGCLAWFHARTRGIRRDDR